MRICFIPIDNRPVCYTFAENIVKCDDSIEFYIPPRGLLGGLTKSADITGIYNWLQTVPQVDCMVVSLDTIAYGGLVASRRISDNFTTIKSNLEKFKYLLQKKSEKIFAFSSIMRISNNNINTEEKEYWSKYGKKIFEYSYNRSKRGFSAGEMPADIPCEILDDYIKTRRRNFDINKIYLEWKLEGIFDVLIFSKDDCAEYGFNIDEAREIQSLGGNTMTGADEIPLTLLARALDKKISVCPIYIEESSKRLVSKYEDLPVESSIIRQAELAGFSIKSFKDSDIILIVNNFKIEQGEIIMKIPTEPFCGEFIPPDKPYIIADIRYANGADNNLVEQIFDNGRDKNFIGYAGWNTTANTTGSLLCMAKYIFEAQKFNVLVYNKLLMTRFLDDWAYQANIRQTLTKPCDISTQMKPYIKRIENFLGCRVKESKFSYPWDRLFETEIDIELENKYEFNRNYTFSNSALY